VGFAPTLPTNYSWSPVGERLYVPYEAPQGRRINGIGAYFSHGVRAGQLTWVTYASLPKSTAQTPRTSPAERAAVHGLRAEEVGPIDGERLVQFIWRVAGRPSVYPEGWQRERPLVIVLDNYSVHKSQAVKAALSALERAGITLFYLPSYSPELSAIEPIWQAVKHQELRQRSYRLLAALKQAVEQALERKAAALLVAHQKTVHSLPRVA
jgi:DDE superfamily endonuclease